MTYILGISAFYHDAAACLVKDGIIVAAAQEERFTRKKHDPSFPINAIRYCLDAEGIDIDQVDQIGYYEKPFLKFDRLLSIYAAVGRPGWTSFPRAIKSWFSQKLWISEVFRRNVAEQLSPSKGRKSRWDGRVIFTQHHQSHAASAFYPSPFEAAAIVTLDGVGEWATCSVSRGYLDEDGVPRMEAMRQINFPHSVGLLYTAFTDFLGFKPNSGEYKVMGLAPYGEPKYADMIFDRLVVRGPDGAFSVNLEYFTYHYSDLMTNDRFAQLFGIQRRESESQMEQVHYDIAASIQLVCEELVLAIVRQAKVLTGAAKLCLSGGVALNCVANGRILRESGFEDVWTQPAAGDAGGAVGVALFIWHEVLNGKRMQPEFGSDMMKGAYLGPSFTASEIEAVLNETGLPFEKIAEDELPETVAELLVGGKVTGWFQGRMEFGPRALGNRSIIADPRNPAMQKNLNLRIKFRESFRPFAPSVLREKVEDWFDLSAPKGAMLGKPGEGYDSPYMLLVAPIGQSHRKPLPDNVDNLAGLDKLYVDRSEVSACTHVDYSARIQTVHEDTNPRYHALISAFERKTGVPIIVNTSFNVRGEPIVCTPNDAIRCFLGTDMDVLVMENYVVRKENVAKEKLIERDSYLGAFSLD